MIKLIKEFLEYKKLRDKVNLVKPSSWELEILKWANLAIEERLNSLVLYELSKELVNEAISPEYYRWYRQALIWREQFIKSSKGAWQKK